MLCYRRRRALLFFDSLHACDSFVREFVSARVRAGWVAAASRHTDTHTNTHTNTHTRAHTGWVAAASTRLCCETAVRGGCAKVARKAKVLQLLLLRV